MPGLAYFQNIYIADPCGKLGFVLSKSKANTEFQLQSQFHIYIDEFQQLTDTHSPKKSSLRFKDRYLRYRLSQWDIGNFNTMLNLYTYI
ncbi:hypothetical protein HanHA300_Chr11g0417281 [Helianthus annuus]|nr:hypothetical protein HanHA300_Chr11g0417281 [Helianthus annuus]KAJ0511031.1 hypothetical protein HanIR_Chr11g0547381 [Helianthus annuus]KAJ0518779.1 hypothetical protein HanHA89_Chr11g0441271 [Helianthus annuus]